MRIKGFDKNLCCRGMQYEIGKEYTTDRKNLTYSDLCTNRVLHYCDNLQQVNQYYSCNYDNRYCEIEVLGEEVSNGYIYGSNHIKIVREIVGEELELLKGHINGNTGLFNSGLLNSGDFNSGDDNIGNRNSGDDNIGSKNSGDGNSGYRNSGSYNSGDINSGDRNSGDYNSGSCNSGGYNSGNYNSGCNNTGLFNSGLSNSGDRNSGNYNSGNRNGGHGNSGDNNNGHYNSGDNNTGYYNSGERNSGERNSGMFNSCNRSNGVFCTENDENIRIFNIPSGMSYDEFLHSKYCDAIYSSPFALTEWIEYTDEEKKESEQKVLDGGYLKKYTYNEACKNWWKNMSEENKEIVKSIPNFNAEVFEYITGIKV